MPEMYNWLITDPRNWIGGILINIPTFVSLSRIVLSPFAIILMSVIIITAFPFILVTPFPIIICIVVLIE